jgi:hypothetical protein
MTLSLEEMLEYLHDRTKVRNNDPMLVRELNAGLDESWKRLSAVFTDLQLTFETTGTFSADTQQFDLGAEIALLGGTFYQSKTFWIKATSGDKYIPVVFMDANDPRFIAQDQLDAQVVQPVYASLVNFNEIRFAPTLPSGTYWRADWIGNPPKLSLATNTQTSLPDPLHFAVVEYAQAKVMKTLDDTRDSMRDFESTLMSGIHAIKRRQNQTKQGTAPYPGGARTGAWPQG